MNGRESKGTTQNYYARLSILYVRTILGLDLKKLSQKKTYGWLKVKAVKEIHGWTSKFNGCHD